MNQLVIIQNQQALTNSQVIAESFEKAHNHVLRDIDGLKGVIQNWTDLFYEDTYIHPQNKQRYRMFYMNRDGFTLLAMGFTGQKAIQFKLAYIQAFNEMEQRLFEINQPSYMIGDPVKRAEKWIEEQKEKQQLETKIEQQRPKVVYAEAVQVSEDTVLVKDLAMVLRQKGIDIGEGRLFKWLRENGYLCKQKGDMWNMPTQRSLDLGIIAVKHGLRTGTGGEMRKTRTPKITGKGQIYFINKFLSEANKLVAN